MTLNRIFRGTGREPFGRAMRDPTRLAKVLVSVITALALGGLAGVLLGAWLSSVLPARPLRAALSVALFGLGIELCWKACS